MDCPYCNEPMKEGIVRGDRFRLKWIPIREDERFNIRAYFKNRIFLEKSLGDGVTTYYCEKDKIFLIKHDGDE